MNKEIEYKTLINFEQFNRIIKYFKPSVLIKQTNYYFDDDKQSIKNSGLSLRIREINNEFICTIKEKIDENTRIEHELISSGLNLNNIPDLKHFLLKYKINVSHLKILGSLTTYRYLLKINHGELCLDENHYNGLVDYEIEYEQKEECACFFEEFLDILKKADIEYQPAESKIFRCLNSIFQDKHN